MKNIFYFSSDDTSTYSDYDDSCSDSDDDTTSSAATEDEKMWKLITTIDEEATCSVSAASVASAALCKCYGNGRNLSKGVYKDVSIKVNSDVYQLDRVTLAIKSDYFEKTFTSNLNNQESEFFEIHSIDSDTFSTIVDVMYGQDLRTVLTVNNFAALLLAMDYLQMEIDLKVFGDFMAKNLKIPLSEFPNVFKLHNSIAGRANFEYFLPTIHQYFSIHLLEFQQCENYLHLSLKMFIKVITRNQFPQYSKEKRKIAQICTLWICKDIENRLIHMAALVNAAKYRYDFPFRLDDRSMNPRFLTEIENESKQKREMERYFNNLLYQNGVINPGEQYFNEKNANNVQVSHIVNKINENDKWIMFLENNYFYDITIKAGKKHYKLHRLKLESKSDYFILEYRNDDRSAKILDKDEVQCLEDIDELTFETIIDFIYFDETYFKPNVKISDLFKASFFLEIYEMVDICKSEITTHLNAPRIDDEFIKILNFMVGKKECKDLLIVFRKQILSTWPKVGTLPEFCTISYHTLRSILTLHKLEINHPNEILDMCSKWVAYNAKKRYFLLPRIANVITQNCYINYYNYTVTNPADWENCSEQFVKDKLMEILSSISSVVSYDYSQSELNESSVQSEPSEPGEPISAVQPAFIATTRGDRNSAFDILDLEFNVITTINTQKSFYSVPSAALINDNVFILFKIKKKFSFLLYNLSSKQFFSLALCHELIKMNEQHITLLNCNNELYCCCLDGTILKYSLEFNRWMIILKNVQVRDKILHASDGSTLYRLSRQSLLRYGYIVEAYDSEENSWTPLPAFPSRIHRLYFSTAFPSCLAIVNGSPAILIVSDIILFDRQSRKWYDIEIDIPNLLSMNLDYGASIFTQHGENIMCMRDKKIWHVCPADGASISNGKILPNEYFTIVAIHSINQ